MRVEYYDILVRPIQQGSKQKLSFWAIGNVLQDTSPYSYAITLWGVLDGAIRYKNQGWLSSFRLRALVRKKRKQAYFVPDDKTLEQVVDQLEKHMTWITLST